MAVDANVLIFARMREELHAGKRLNASIHEGFSRAWLSVRDSHATLLIGSFVLYAFTTSIVKGFALTTIAGLSLGVLIARPAYAAITEILLKD